jgi:hypothetical protein
MFGLGSADVNSDLPSPIQKSTHLETTSVSHEIDWQNHISLPDSNFDRKFRLASCFHSFVLSK